MRQWTTKDFPIGFYHLHPDFSIDFQMNRFYNWTNDETMLEEMRNASSTILSYNDLIKSFVELGEISLRKKETLKAAYYFRGAEFYLPESDPNKQELRKQFITLVRDFYGITKNQHYMIPYENGFLSAYRISPERPKGTIVIFGGFDSYVEELFMMTMVFRDAGYDVICFDGPGQGSALEDYKIPMSHKWERPVKSILDYFELDDVTLIGVSLGGYLSLRAAAYEKRVKRVIAYDVLMDFYDVLTNQLEPDFREIFNDLIAQEKAKEINEVLKKLMGKSLMLEWGIMQGMHITGSNSPYDFFQCIIAYNTESFSHFITQDVLLLAGQNDHYVPIKQFTNQISALTKVHSLTARMFTSEESADTHCQIGNLGLATEVILNWINQVS
ncbi:alpha/beta hydrolase [Lacrimispora algidixylanolytica]|uniref:Alpha/beta hydrolase n=1 Tax=Lacrimispora algidixylanolytica TaxID=94868 RepID=A0A419T0T0_9FIRM|nr:alpha/beta fold hydrolase [Lacrimispora algidixylanolytica]RKD31067.1 alpha/beta hydrolase [Lacrimispora algidixylanolytica]